MHKQGHHGLNALLYAPIAVVVAVFASVELSILGAVLFVGMASVPDFDRHFDNNMNSHRSNLWTFVPIKHRGFTHTVWCALLLGSVGGVFAAVIGGGLTPAHSPIVVGVFGGGMVAGGVFGHMLGDVMTPMGVRPFKPVSGKKYSLAWFLAKNKIANYGFLILGGGLLLAAFGVAFTEIGFDLSDYAAVLQVVPEGWSW